MKKICSLFVLTILVLIIAGCNDQPVVPTDSSFTLQKYGEGGGGGHTETLGNNLSFPALIADGYTLTPVDTNFMVPYSGLYPGLTTTEILALEASGPWYPQKTEGNSWQADNAPVGGPLDIDFIDWGDNIESVSPKINRPFRIEVVIFKSVTAMTAYKMSVLEFPSSSKELQGTNKETYESSWATVASNKAKLVIQKFSVDPDSLTWNGSYWEKAELPVNISFGTELNVGGKLIYGASQGGWKPTEFGNYRVTFYIPNSVVNLSNAQIGNFVDGTITPLTMVTLLAEGGVNLPVVDALNNLTYVDIEVAAGGGGNKGRKP